MEWMLLRKLRLSKALVGDMIKHMWQLVTALYAQLQAANAAGLEANLSSPAYSFTLLAPNDAAFTTYLSRTGVSYCCSDIGHLAVQF